METQPTVDQSRATNLAELKACPFFENLLRDALWSISADDDEIWLRVGKALRGWHRGLDLWDDWNRTSNKFKEGECAERWETFDRDGEDEVHLSLIFEFAQAVGWKSDDLIVSQLATLNPLELDRWIDPCARVMGVKRKTLEKVVLQRQADCKGVSVQSQFVDVEPWPDPVSGEALLDQLSECFTRFLVLPENASEACALWVLHTYCFELFTYTPRLHAKSPVKRCGKTALLSLLSNLVRRGIATSDLTGAMLFRVIERHQPTVLIDEWDSMSSEKGEALRNVLNSGFQRGGATWRTQGLEPRQFPTFSPVAVASIGRLPETVADRAITIPMRRKMPHETVESSRKFDGTELKRKCRRWVQDNIELLREIEPEIPSELNDRLSDCWEVLLALADVAGDKWNALANKVAVALSVAIDDDGEVVGDTLLRDVRTIFDCLGGDRIFSAVLLQQLNRIEEAPWSTLLNGRPLNAHRLGRMLSAFGVVSRTIREGTYTAKGYYRRELMDAWERYLPMATKAKAPATSLSTEPGAAQV